MLIFERSMNEITYRKNRKGINRHWSFRINFASKEFVSFASVGILVLARSVSALGRNQCNVVLLLLRAELLHLAHYRRQHFTRGKLAVPAQCCDQSFLAELFFVCMERLRHAIRI